MNPIKELYANLSNEELESAMDELMESDETGIIPDGTVRDIARRVGTIMDTKSLDIFAVQIAIYKECATRWWFCRGL